MPSLCLQRLGASSSCSRLKLIDKTPVVELYKSDKDKTVERECEYVYTATDYQTWLSVAREPLRSASILAHDSGICRGELLALEWDCVNINKTADENGLWGILEIRRGLKRKERRRDLPITEDMAAVFSSLRSLSKCQHLFTCLRDRTQPLSGNTLANQHRDIMETCSFHPDAGLHALRHTFLTEAGRHTKNVRALQRLAGHSQIETTMRYVHSDQDDIIAIAGAVQIAREKRNKKSSGVATILATVAKQENRQARKM